MRNITNAKLLGRIAIAALGFGLIGFVCGYFGPSVLKADAGMAPITGFLAGPVCAAIGVACAVDRSVAGVTPPRYAKFMVAAAGVLAALTLLLAVSQ
jgi:hypothetical protein